MKKDAATPVAITLDVTVKPDQRDEERLREQLRFVFGSNASPDMVSQLVALEGRASRWLREHSIEQARENPLAALEAIGATSIPNLLSTLQAIASSGVVEVDGELPITLGQTKMAR
ncbi:MAG: hypothetical protein JNK05_15880 [Myxococcales bacterium]|nr:hypothetical protein [Myxococcales bacterium]